MAGHGQVPKFFLIALPTLAAVLALALAAIHFRPQAQTQPQARAQPQTRLDSPPLPDPTERHFLGSISFDLPAGFQATSGRLQLLCPGPPSLTRVREIPHPPLDRTDQLFALVPADPPPFSLVEAETNFGRPALWAFVQDGPDEVRAYLVLGFESGAVLLSRLFPADRLEEEKAAFTAEARGFAEKYAWGHEGAGPGERFSLHGRLRLEQTCRLRGSVKFTAPETAVEISWPETGKPDDPPGRLLRSGPRLLAGRPGQESVTQDPEAGLAAVWRPEEEGEAVIFLSAPDSSADLALGYWDAILNSVRFFEDEKIDEGNIQEIEAPEPEVPPLPPALTEDPETARVAGEEDIPDSEPAEPIQEAAPEPEIPEVQEPVVEPEIPEVQEPVMEPEVPEIEPVREHAVEEPDGQEAVLEDQDDEWTALGLGFLPEEDIPDDQ